MLCSSATRLAEILSKTAVLSFLSTLRYSGIRCSTVKDKIEAEMNEIVKHDEIDQSAEMAEPMPAFSGNKQDYMILRAKIVEKCEELNGGNLNPKAHPGSLAVFSRLEKSIRETALFAAPDGTIADRAFMVGMEAFLR
jgi:hypothetical protein